MFRRESNALFVMCSPLLEAPLPATRFQFPCSPATRQWTPKSDGQVDKPRNGNPSVMSIDDPPKTDERAYDIAIIPPTTSEPLDCVISWEQGYMTAACIVSASNFDPISGDSRCFNDSRNFLYCLKYFTILGFFKCNVFFTGRSKKTAGYNNYNI